MRIARGKDYGLNPAGKIGRFMTLHPNLLGRIGRSMIPQPS